MVIVPCPASNVRRSDAEITPGPSYSPSYTKLTANKVSALSLPPNLLLTSSDRIDPQPKEVLV